KKPPYKVEDVYTGSDTETDSETCHASKKSQKEEEPNSPSDDEIEDSEVFIGPNGTKMSRAERNSPINCLEYLNKIRISRFRIDSWIYMPFFSDTIIGCYVRINIGMSEGRPIYRIAEI
ncbi:hypothetical protein, partial [Salmonella sp. s51228]|uniref:Plus-3 domain-containing protein n=1 Tax=Salmonella sp. s51228 TaxID=3159652 RepID=UPI00397EDEE2